MILLFWKRWWKNLSINFCKKNLKKYNKKWLYGQPTFPMETKKGYRGSISACTLYEKRVKCFYAMLFPMYNVYLVICKPSWTIFWFFLAGLGRNGSQARTGWWGPIRDENISSLHAFSLYYVVFIPSMWRSSSYWRSCTWQNDSAKICIKITGKGMEIAGDFAWFFFAVILEYLIFHCHHL